MSKRSIHWYEGMFLRPHHMQVFDRDVEERVRLGEDWLHPFNWGLRSVRLDRDAAGNYQAVLRQCEARFKDGTKVSVPDDVPIGPLDLKPSLAASPSVDVLLALPSWHPTRPNVEEAPTASGPRWLVQSVEIPDENTGGDEQTLEVRRVQARLLVQGQEASGYQVLPIGRYARSGDAQAPPVLDVSYVPPILALDAWPPLHEEVQSLYHQIGAKIEQLAGQSSGRGITFESQVPGDAERLLKLWSLNTAYSYLQSVVFLRGLHPYLIYSELCRLVGALGIFSPARRPKEVPPYDHEAIGPCYAAVISEIRSLLEGVAPVAFEKRYLERAGERLQSALESGWLTSQHKLYLGVETDLNDEECHRLLVGSANRPGLDMKLGSGRQVEEIFRRRVLGLKFVPVGRPPRQLPAGAGIVYYQVERTEPFWADVVASLSLGLQIKREHAAFKSDRILSVTNPETRRTADMQFALFVFKDS